MKYIKYYEHSIEEEHPTPKIGDYVIMQTNQDDIKEYIATHIGQIQYIEDTPILPKQNRTKFGYNVLVKYENVPDNIIKLQIFDYDKYDTKVENYNVRTFSTNQIVEFAPTIEELKQKLLKNKFNL